MARRRRNSASSEEKTYNRGGYSQAALDALESGRYREFSGNRQSQYRTSQEQTQAAPKPVPALEGMTRSPEFSGRNSYVDTDRARAKYAEKINYTPFTLETPQTSNDENYVVKRDRYDKLMQDSRLANDIKNLYYAQPDGYGGEIVPEGYKNHKEYREQLSKRYNLTKDELDDMVKTFGSDIYKESTARDKKLMQNYGKEHPVLGSLASFVGTLGGFGEGAVNAVSGLLTGDDRNLSHTFSNTKNSFREGAKKNIKSNAGKTAYDIGMGIGDMAVGAAAGSAPVVLAGNTANEAQESALKRGSSVRKSSLYGAGAGVLDFVTNKVGLDKAKKLAVDSIKSSGVKKFLAQNAIAGLGEAGENVLQDIGQSLLDLINGGNAELIQSYNDKITRGMSDTDAFKEVAKEYATQLATSGALGFGMGSAMQAGSTIAPKVPQLVADRLEKSKQGQLNMGEESINTTSAPRASEVADAIRSGEIVEPDGFVPSSYQVSRGVDAIPTEEYKAIYRKSGKNTVINDGTNYRAFIDDAIDNASRNTNNSFYLGKVNGELATDLSNALGEDFTGKHVLIDESHVQHTYKKHGPESKAAKNGEVPVTRDDIESALEAFNKPDKCYWIENNSLGQRQFKIQKRIDGYIYTVFATKNGADTNGDILIEDMYKSPTAFNNGGDPSLNLTSESGQPLDSNSTVTPDVQNVNRTMAESAGARNPRLVKKLEGDELKAAQKKVADNNNAINALKNEIKVIENDPKNKHRGSLKKSAKADIEQKKAQIAELQNDNKTTKRQINGEPTPVIEQLDADSVSRINSFKSEVRKIGNMWGGENGKQLAKEVNDALDRYIETGSQEDFNAFARDLWQLHSSANGEYTSNSGNVSRYSDYYGDIEDGIFGSAIRDNGMLPNGAIRDFHSAMNETADIAPVPPSEPPVDTDSGIVPPEGGDRVRSFSRRGSNDETLPDEIRNTLSEDYYKIVRNQDVEARADLLFVPENLTQTRSNLDRAVEDHDPAAALLSYRLAKAYVDNGDYDAATDVLQNVSAELTRMGQFTQAAKLAMLQNDPMAAMRSYMRDLEKLNQWGRDKYKGKWKNLELSEEDIATISKIQKGDSEALNSAIDALNEKFSKQIPSNWWDKTVSATKTAMLLNPRTQFRNVLANMATLPLRSASDRVAALGQNIAHLINDDVKVTQSVLGGTKEQKNIAAQVFDRLKDEITGENKMKDSVKSDILSQRQIFNDDFLGKWVDNLTNGGIQRLNEKFGANGNRSIMETLQNLTYWLMGDVGDTPFVKKNFVNRLASYMKAQGINNVDDIPDEAISLATQEALKATFKDDNAFTKALQGVKQKTGKFGEVALPFVKTPANLTMRAIDYSPAGLINTFRKIKSNADASAVIDDLSKNLTGTALIYLGYKLAEKGLLSGSYSQDADEAAFQKQQGMLENAIHIGDNYYTYDWTQPASTPLVLGQTIYEGVKASDQENASIKDIVNATYKGGLRVANTIINSSPLQSLSDLLGDSPYGEEGIAENITNEILEFPQRFIPSVVGATARTIDPVMRDTYIKDTTLTGTLGNQARQAMAKVPFLSRTLPASYDTWGNERTRSDSKGEAFFAQMVNPGQLGNKNETPLDSEIQRIFDATGNKAVFPLNAARSLDLGSDGNITLTNKQHSEYQKAMGQRSYSYAESIINNPEYQNLSDDEKASMLEKAYKLSNDITKEEMFNHVTDNNKNLKEVARTGDSEAVAKYLFDKIKADNLGMTMKTYQEKEAESPGGAVAHAQMQQAAKESGFVNKNGNVDTKGYEKVISKAGAQSEKLINDLPALQQTGLEKSAYYTYANAINVIPSLTPSEFAQTYNEINTNKDNAMTQKELLAFLNMYQFSDDPAEDERIANEYWRAYGGWTNKAGVEKKIKFQNGQWKSYY